MKGGSLETLEIPFVLGVTLLIIILIVPLQSERELNISLASDQDSKIEKFRAHTSIAALTQNESFRDGLTNFTYDSGDRENVSRNIDSTVSRFFDVEENSNYYVSLTNIDSEGNTEFQLEDSKYEFTSSGSQNKMSYSDVKIASAREDRFVFTVGVRGQDQ